jgi:PBSX family phage terminase large subunit
VISGTKVKQFGPKAHYFICQHPALDRKYTLLVGSVRSSKTWAVTAKLIVHLCRYKVEGRRVICGKTKQTVYKNILIDLFEIVGKGNYSYNANSGELWLFPNDSAMCSQWFVMGAKDEASFTNILGMTIGIFIGDEVVEYPYNFFKQIFLRMSPEGARFYGTTNPGHPLHHVKTEFIDSKQFANDLTVLEFTLDDNPNLSEEAVRTIKASQTGVFYLRYILGRWIAAEGAIYKDAWSDSLLYTPSEIAPGLYGFGGYVDHLLFMDYGTANPFTAIEAIDDGRQLWLDRQYWWDSSKELRQKTDGEYADDIEAWMSPTGYKDSNGVVSISRVARRGLPRVILDPSATSMGLELRKRGFWVIDADNDVIPGIRKMATVMTRKLLRVNRECEEFLREVPAYMWDPDALKRDGEEKPIKQNDHSCLVAGTPVWTDHGWQRIETVRVGQLAMTRAGWRRIQVAGQTGTADSVFEVRLSNGTMFTGTGNHPVWVEDAGFTEIDMLRAGDMAITPDGTVFVESVQSVKQRQPVFNLAVEGEHEYFAAGVLVHNCDASRYGIMEVFGDWRLLQAA